MILDGFLDSSTEATMADQLGVSARHLRRLFREHLGVSPNELAKSTRAHFARRLLDDTDVSVTEIAFAAGFGSVRQMNRVFREIFLSTPTELRAKRRRADRLVADGGLPLRLPFEGPYDWAAMFRYLKASAVPGVEYVTDHWYRRTIFVDGDPGVLEIKPLDDQHLMMVAHLPHWEGLIHIARRASSMFGLTTPTDRAREHLGEDPILGPLVDRFPGVRVPGAWDPFETAIVTIIGQENSPVETRLIAGRLVRQHGQTFPGLAGLGLTHLFPSPNALLGADLDDLGISDRARHAIHALTEAAAVGESTLDLSTEAEHLVSSVSAIPGVTNKSSEYIAWRLGFQDVLPIDPDELTELIRALGGQPEGAKRDSESWRPWRSLAASYLMVASPVPAVQAG